MNTGWPNKSGSVYIGNGMTLSTLEAASKVPNGNNSVSKYSEETTTDVFNADDQDDSQGGVGGRHSYRLGHMSDCTCITSSRLAEAERTTGRTFRLFAYRATKT
jgi:hypothetical protein